MIMLDLIFSHDKNAIVHLDENFILQCDSHHLANMVILEVPAHLSYDTFYYDFKRAYYISLIHYYNTVNWENLLNIVSDFNLVFNTFYEYLFYVIGLYVPDVCLRTHKIPPWFSPELKSLILQKKITHNIWKETHIFKFVKNFQI